jgi:hypothetical protein
LVVAAVALTSVAFPTLAPAQASASVTVTGGSWYWQEQVGTVEPPAGSPLPPVAPPGAIPTPDVPAGDFPVSVVAGQPDKETFLQLDSSAIPAGSSVSSLVLTLNEDPGASGKLNPDTATIEARAVTGFMTGGDAGKPWANRPSYDTTGPAAGGKRAADGTWTFDLTQIANGWASGTLSNNGIALVPANPQQGQAYEVVWFGPGGAKAPTVVGSVTPPAPGTPAAAAAGIEGSPTDQSSPISLTPDTSGGLTSATPSFSSPAAGGGPVSTPAAGNSVAPARARAIGSTHGSPPWGFYLAVIVVIALIGASTVSLGDFGEPQPERQGGVLRTLERQRERSNQEVGA